MPTTQMLQFPKGGVGTLELLENHENVPEKITDYEQPLWTARAAGAVRVPRSPNGIIMLKLNNDAMAQPKLMKQIPPAGIDCLKVGLWSMSAEEVTATDKCLAGISHFKDLRYLAVDSTDASDGGLQVVSSLQNLRGINISATPVNGTIFKTLAALPKLQEVMAERCNINEEKYADLSRSATLEKLNLRWSNITVKGLQLLVPTKNLRTLFLTKESHIGDAAMPVLTRMKNLRYLRLNTSPITDRGVATLSVMTELRELGLGETGVTDACIPNLRKMTKLTAINLGGTRVTERGLVGLQGLKLKKLQIPENLKTPVIVAKLQKIFPSVQWQFHQVGFKLKDDIRLLAEPGVKD